MDLHKIHAAVEIADKVAGGADTTSGWAKAIAASEGYRKYSWLKNAPATNVAGNFRGMVINPKWAARFQWADAALKPVEHAAVLLTLAANIAKSSHEIAQILSSRDDWTVKGARLSTQVSSVAIRTVLSGATGFLDLSTFVASGYLQIADLAGVRRAKDWNKSINAADAWVNTTVDRVTDGNNMYLFINSHMVMQ